MKKHIKHIQILMIICIMYLMITSINHESSMNKLAEQNLKLKSEIDDLKISEIIPRTVVDVVEPKIIDVDKSITEECITSNDSMSIDNMINSVSSIYSVSPYLIKAIIWQESKFEINPSTGDGIGLMQINIKWHEDRAEKLGVIDLYDPYNNILVGTDYISELLDKFEDPRLALMMYNMNHNKALEFYNNGIISKYATSVLNKASEYEREAH